MTIVGTSATPRADWLAARALLASRRLRPRVPLALLAFALVFGAVYAIRGPWAHREAEMRRAAALAAATQRDTLPLLEALQRASAEFDARDSVLRARQSAVARGPAATLLPAQQQTRDSLRGVLLQLDAARERAAKAPLPASYRSLAASRALRTVPAAQALADTLNLLDRARADLDPVAAPQSEFARLSQRANAIGTSLQALASARHTVLQQQIAAVEASGEAPRDTTASSDTASARIERDAAQQRVARADSALRATRRWHAALQQQADSVADDRAARILGASPVAAAFGAMLLVLAFTFTTAVWREARQPTVAHAREVERLSGLPVLATALHFRAVREGRERLLPGTGVDAFRMVYLGLTASGTRERAVCVTGDDPTTTTVVAARLAINAAADEHATLVVDLAPGHAGTAAHFGVRDEPGFSEAIAGVRLWREVARPIGASEGIAIDVAPAGAPRQDTDESVQSASARSEFNLFAGDYDFTVLCATTDASVVRATAVMPSVPTIFVARLAKSQLQPTQLILSRYREAGIRLHGIILVDEAGK